MTLRMPIGLVIVTLCACAGGAARSAIDVAPHSASAKRQDCQAIDSSIGPGTLVYTECGVDRQAKLRGRQPRMDFNTRLANKECYTALIAVVVDERGSTVPATARIVRTNDTEFAQAFLNTIPAWRFTPAQKNGLPVKQVVQIAQAAVVRRVRSDRPMGPPPSTRAPNC